MSDESDYSAAPILEGHGILLRAPRPSDVDVWSARPVDSEIARMYGVEPDGLRRSDHEARDRYGRLTATPYGWVIEHDGLPVGEIRLDDLDEQTGQARLAIGIDDPDLLGRGLGSEAIRIVIDHAFGELGLDHVWLRVVEYNARAIRAYRKCGFTVHRREPDAVDIDGRSYDDIIMGLSASDWQQRKRQQKREETRDSL